MKNKSSILIISGLVIGIIIGYFIFATILGQNISVLRLLGLKGSNFAGRIMGLNEIRLKILFSGIIGGAIGFVLGKIIK